MKLEVMTPATLIDITGIGELADFDTSNDPLRFGALARMADVAGALERLATTGRLDGAHALVQQLAEEFRQAEAALAPELGGPPR